jgi:hypothetical protein
LSGDFSDVCAFFPLFCATFAGWQHRGKVTTASWKQPLLGVVQFEPPLLCFIQSVRSSFQYAGSTLKEYFDDPIALLKHCFILTSGHFHFMQLLMIPDPTSIFDS